MRNFHAAKGSKLILMSEVQFNSNPKSLEFQVGSKNFSLHYYLKTIILTSLQGLQRDYGDGVKLTCWFLFLINTEALWRHEMGVDWELGGDQEDHEGVRTKEVLNNLLGQGIKEKVHHHWGRRPLGKGRAGQALTVCMG